MRSSLGASGMACSRFVTSDAVRSKSTNYYAARGRVVVSDYHYVRVAAVEPVDCSTDHDDSASATSKQCNDFQWRVG